MKNIVICFDGTWNTSDAPEPTNVVKTARLLTPKDSKGAAQVVFYDAGVGSERVAFGKSINSLLGGAFGAGLLNNIEHAYRSLIFNYAPGDRIFVFGFSRGAFSARSFGGLLRKCGILRKENVHLVGKAIDKYKRKAVHPDDEECMAFRHEHSVRAWHSAKEREWRRAKLGAAADGEMRLQIEYMGIWDTVGAMGVPAHVAFADFFNKRYRFHDCGLSSMVRNGRHALAIDERRRIFDATLWTNVAELNQLVSAEIAEGGATGLRLEPAYLQHWFPGDHGSVGGGGDEVGLSDAALVWIVEGAVALGLGIDSAELSVHRKNINHLAPLHNLKRPAFDVTSFATRKRRKALWEVQPDDLSECARQRLMELPERLPESRAYRPRPLRAIADALVAAAKSGLAAVKKAA
jgi:uncharacterized protein (DUF2235 family)